MKKIQTSLMSLLMLLPLFAGLLTFAAPAQAEVDELAVIPDEVQVILHKRIFRDLRWKSLEEQVQDWSYQGNGMALDLQEEQTSLPFDGAVFRVWDATSWVLSAQEAAINEGEVFNAENLVTDIASMTNTEAQAAAEDANLPEIYAEEELITAEDQVGGLGRGILRLPNLPVYDEEAETFKAYLIAEVGVTKDEAMNVDVLQKARPLLVVLPLAVAGEFLTDIHVYPKNVGYVRDPYFYKFGETENGKGDLGPIQGAEFVIYREVDGEKRYLKLGDATDLENQWIVAENDDPANDAQIDKFTSDASGLVDTGARYLPSGTFYFEEVQAAPGYEIQAKDQKIEIVVPTSWDEPVLIDGQEMLESFDGQVPEAAQESQTPRIYNRQIAKEEEPTPEPTPTPESTSDSEPEVSDTVEESSDTLPTATTPSTPARPNLPETGAVKPSGILPKTGEVKATISVVGMLLIVGVVALWLSKRHEGHE